MISYTDDSSALTRKMRIKLMIANGSHRRQHIRIIRMTKLDTEIMPLRIAEAALILLMTI